LDKLKTLFDQVENFCKETHGSSEYYKDESYIVGENNTFAPLSYLCKKEPWLKSPDELIKLGLIADTFEFNHRDKFLSWYEKQFSRKLKRSQQKNISFLLLPQNKEIFDAVEAVYKNYEILRNHHIIQNNKNLPVQLGEWYAKCIFGLVQVKSASQRGFDFYYEDERAEVKVEWGEFTSPKGIKLRKSAIGLAKYCIIMYLAKDFKIREICFLDSSFITRKFGSKGHTIFLKDTDISDYFLSQSNKHIKKVVNSNSLLKFATPRMAVNLAESF